MRRAVRSTWHAVGSLAVAAPVFAQVGAPATRTGFSLTPYIGVLVPTEDLFSYQNGTATQVTKISAAITFGGRLGIGIGRRVGIEGDVGYSPGSVCWGPRRESGSAGCWPSASARKTTSTTPRST